MFPMKERALPWPFANESWKVQGQILVLTKCYFGSEISSEDYSYYIALEYSFLHVRDVK